VHDGRLDTAVSASQTTSYDYDAAANLVTTTLPSGNGHVEERTFDEAGRLTRVKHVKGEATLAGRAAAGERAL
jgi:YD repeat-containing protein